MSAAYQKELDFMTAVLRRMRLAVHLLHPGDSLENVDAGLRSMLGLSKDYEQVIHNVAQWPRRQAIYKVLDQFMCHYIYFQLPQVGGRAAVVIGPYLTRDPSRELLLEQAERIGLPMLSLSQQEEYYASLPVFNDPSPIMAVVTALGEVLWGAEGFDLVDVNDEQSGGPSGITMDDGLIEQTDILHQMKQMEERYAYENELMEIVAKGLTNQAEGIMSSVSSLNYQQRLADPLRNMKNYCIICNTLLRKAAQQGGVHPYHLDSMSSQYARMIENCPTLENCGKMIGEMIRAYCRLVRTHAGGQYSAVVQKTMTYINANLSANLSLSELASLMQITPGYLSTVFHRETGLTLTRYIAEQRMKAALQLLRMTRLQVQSIAQLCGFSDPNYFSKQFRRCYGMTPMQYRRENQWHVGSGEG